MVTHEFSSELVEEFYNSCHSKANGTFCGGSSKGKGVIRVPMSEAASRSNAILRRLASDRKSKEYKTAKARIHDTWANREVGQGGLRGIKGANSKKADAARATNAVKGGKTKKLNNLNTKAHDASAERAKAQIAMLMKASKDKRKALEKINTKNQKELKTGSKFALRPFK